MGGARRTDPETSKLAYEQMKADGTLSKRRLEAAECMATAPYPMTAGEMAQVMRTNRNNLATRLSELEHLGIALKSSERECKVSEKFCWTWELTGVTTPTGDIPKNINTTEIIRGQRDKAVNRLEEAEMLINNVVVWLDDISTSKSPEQCIKAATKLRERWTGIMKGKRHEQD